MEFNILNEKNEFKLGTIITVFSLPNTPKEIVTELTIIIPDSTQVLTNKKFPELVPIDWSMVFSR